MKQFLSAAVVCLSLLSTMGTARCGDWPQFRGPGGQGHAEAGPFPLTWSESKNVAWKTAVPGLGWSSPSIQGDQIWLTTALEEGRSLRAICLSRRSGRILHDVEVFQKQSPGPIHAKNSHASPTPIVEGDRVYLHFGGHGTACITTDGRAAWKNEELKYNHRHGPGGSPVLYQDLMILSCDGTDVQFIVALDKADGRIRWKQERKGAMAYSTPLVIRAGGQDQVVSTCGEWAAAYEPKTGRELWKLNYPGGYSNVPRPVFDGKLVFLISGYNTPSLFAVRPDGSGDVTATHTAWKLDKGVPHNPSPLLVGSELYMVSDRGVAACLDAETGKVHWQERLKGSYSASPTFAAGRIYFLNEEGLATVIEPGLTYKELSVNTLPGRTLAGPAFCDGAIFLRTDTHLYRIEEGDRAEN